LRGIATAALDISDGLLGDLKHILDQSKVDAEILLDRLPKSDTLRKQSKAIQNQFAACGGDDYEICFTAAPRHRNAIMEVGKKLSLSITNIGSVQTMRSTEPKIYLIDQNGKELNETESTPFFKSFDHFA